MNDLSRLNTSDISMLNLNNRPAKSKIAATRNPIDAKATNSIGLIVWCNAKRRVNLNRCGVGKKKIH